MHRIESLFLAFSGLVLFIFVMRPGTDRFFMRIFPWWLRAFLTSLLLALFVSVMLFGILGTFLGSGVDLVQQYRILFLVVWVIGTTVFFWGNRPDGLGDSLWPPEFPAEDAQEHRTHASR
jgi:hypothetical protein